MSTMDRLFKACKLSCQPKIPRKRIVSVYFANYSVTVGSSLRVTGSVAASSGTQDIELHAPTATVLGISPEEPNVPSPKGLTDMSDSQCGKWEHIHPTTCVNGNIYALE